MVLNAFGFRVPVGLISIDLQQSSSTKYGYVDMVFHYADISRFTVLN